MSRLPSKARWYRGRPAFPKKPDGTAGVPPSPKNQMVPRASRPRRQARRLSYPFVILSARRARRISPFSSRDASNTEILRRFAPQNDRGHVVVPKSKRYFLQETVLNPKMVPDRKTVLRASCLPPKKPDGTASVSPFLKSQMVPRASRPRRQARRLSYRFVILSARRARRISPFSCRAASNIEILRRFAPQNDKVLLSYQNQNDTPPDKPYSTPKWYPTANRYRGRPASPPKNQMVPRASRPRGQARRLSYQFVILSVRRARRISPCRLP